MPVYFEYALKVSICLSVVFGFYMLLLKRMTFYTWNRYFLLGFSVLSFVVPFINIRFFVVAESTPATTILNKIPALNASQIIGAPVGARGDYIFWQILSAVFCIVTVILVIRLFIQFVSLQRLRAKSTLLAAGEVNIYDLSAPVLPFSFLNSIFINTTKYSQHELPKIIEHELVHVQQKHTIDVLITEVICILNWYNPFAWLMKKAVRENLEFIADETVINKGVDRRSYQYLLLKVTGDFSSAITSSLKFSSLKNRIMMMNKTKTSRAHLLKFLLLVPVLLVILVAFRGSSKGADEAAVSVNKETYTLSTLTYSIPDPKVKTIVVNAQNNSLLKPGELLDLSLVYKEKDRLVNLLEKNGYGNLKSNAITFMIDTASVNNSFSVEVKIDVEAAVVSTAAGKTNPFTNKVVAIENVNSLFFVQTYSNLKVSPELQADVYGLYARLYVAKSPGC